ncbi:MAG: hypothetical protein ACRC8S_21440 [Fimbriiglobus sp.]
MRLLKLVPPRLVAWIPGQKSLGWIIFALTIMALELIGRLAKADFQDLIGALLLASLLAALLVRRPLKTLPGYPLVQGFLKRLQSQVQNNYGLDLRNDPPYPTRFPAGAWFLALGLLTWTGTAAAVWWLLPAGWRDLGLWTSFSLYLVFITLLWVGLIATIAGSLVGTAFMIDWQLNRRMESRSDRLTWRAFAVIAYLVFVGLSARYIPVVVPLGMTGVLALACFLLASFPRPADMAVLWRSAPGRPIYSLPDTRITAGVLTVLMLLLTNLILSACGGRLITTIEVADPMVLTSVLGTIAAWMLPVFLAMAAYTFWTIRGVDPALRMPLQLAIDSKVSIEQLRSAIKLIRKAGFRSYVSRSVYEATDLRIELVPKERSEAFEFQPTWPLKLSVEDLTHEDVLFRLRRRDELRLRRGAYRGMRRLFRRAFRTRKRKGGVYQFSPHLWIQGNLSYEEPQRRMNASPAPKAVSGMYFSVFHPRVRQHLNKVFRALQVDVILIEDGVKYRSIEALVRSLFEIYDQNDGATRLEEHNLPNVPKARVVMHDCVPDEPRRDWIAVRTDGEDYDENDYLGMSRLRVLHLFKDDNESEADTRDPVDMFWQPSPTSYLS